MRRVHDSSSSAQPRIAIIGANGQLGTDLMKVLADQEPVGLTRDDVDVTVSESVREALGRHRPQIVVNTTAFNQVDFCESDPVRGFLINAIGTHHLAETCRDTGAVLVHFSTDYVFDGAQSTPYSERDLPLPVNAYGASKLAGEHIVRYLLERYFIIRTSGLYGKSGSRGKGGNFVEWMLKAGREGRPVRVVNDQTLAPTYTRDLAEKVKEVILHGEYGLYHITNQGSCSWYEFAQRIFQISGIAADVTPTTTREYGAKARRPAWSVLENGKLRDIGLNALRTWDEALKSYLQD
ncbi:MAG: dTDP-4-dehydrorhamnose reductase [Dehalococcoidia bacterium]|nr:dTDP-4-dehydrorhamnose reductase [Dehalococcoidia bacterium]